MEEININNKIYRRYIDRYYISNDGVMVSVEFDKNNNIKLLRTMKADTSNYGHKRIEIKINTKAVKVLVHRAVYKAWVGELIDGMVIEHLDGNPSNNSYTNLKQSTQKENIHTAIQQGNFHNNNTNIIVYDKYTNGLKEYECIKDFLIDINAPKYMIEHGGLSMLNKRSEYKDRYEVEKVGRKGASRPRKIKEMTN